MPFFPQSEADGRRGLPKQDHRGLAEYPAWRTRASSGAANTSSFSRQHEAAEIRHFPRRTATGGAVFDEVPRFCRVEPYLTGAVLGGLTPGGIHPAFHPLCRRPGPERAAFYSKAGRRYAGSLPVEEWPVSGNPARPAFLQTKSRLGEAALFVNR